MGSPLYFNLGPQLSHQVKAHWQQSGQQKGSPRLSATTNTSGILLQSSCLGLSLTNFLGLQIPRGRLRMAELPQSPFSIYSANCPPGLEYLLEIDQLLIYQQLELLEVIFDYETNNKYEVKNKIGQQIYFATEKSNFCCKLLCGSLRSFKIHIVDNMGTEVICMRRSVRCESCWCPCCLQKLEVQAPPGEPIGYVIQKWHPCLPKFVIQDENKDSVLKIYGPCCLSSCGRPIDFKIKNLDASKTVGTIRKCWSGIVNEALTDVDNFAIKFQMKLDVRIKATLIGACFLIDYMYFENTQR
ncbi:phospholipid scramblase 1-like [Heterodontus francisci]|uniref:phospholipid scramblase 1-like n=1 Tax=Heterodontus francisci TaxID=7792 RepID=UPI00355B9641